MPVFWVLREKDDVHGCTSVAGGRMPEATWMRGLVFMQLSLFYPLTPTLSRREREFMGLQWDRFH
jgi:hypothetical protein